MNILPALVLPFIVVGKDQHLIHEAGPQDARTGSRAMHLMLDPAAAAELNGAVWQSVGAIPPGRVQAQVWHRGDQARITLTFKCIDNKGAERGQASGSATPAAGKWQRVRAGGQFASGCARAEVWIQAHGAGAIQLDDAGLLAGGTNLLKNASFEEGWPGWQQGNGDRHGGMLWVNDTPFVPWGLNYDRTIVDGKDVLLEEAPLDKIDRDFREARRLGANSIRLFLQLGYFMPQYGAMDAARLRHLDEVILRARRRNLRVDLTGLSHIDAANVPAWYLERSPEDVLQGEAAFWEAIAQRYSSEPAIFLFNLQNEPVLNEKDDVRKPFGCFNMSGGRKFCYVNPHPRSIGAERWTNTMIEAVRRHDRKHLLTIGLLPMAAPVFGEGNPGFSIPAVAGRLDVIAIHLYPDRKAPPEEFLDVNRDWLGMVLRYASGFGKPVIVEEWFPLWAPGSTKATEADWFSQFMDASIGSVSGWFTFYHAALVDDATATQPYPRAHIELFARRAEEMRNMKPARKPGTATLSLDSAALWMDHERARQLLREYQRLRAAGHHVDFR